jgi:Predicted methyltransferase (contains TPR repeat)
MESYQSFAKFYDLFMGDRLKTIKLVSSTIKKYHPKAKSILELAVGTGSILHPLSKNYKVSGLDLSQSMLKIAKRKIPKAKLYHQNMVDFKINEKFDVILCLFDSINHVLKFSDWEKIFKNVCRHLNKNGIFIFDINTQYALNTYFNCEPFVQKIKNEIRVVDTENKGNGIVDFIIYVLSGASKERHKLVEDHALETSFPIKKIKTSLNKYFGEISIFDKNFNKPSKNIRRLYFVCRGDNT